MTQAVAVNQLLRQNGHQVVGVLIGKHQHRSLPDFFLNAFDVPVVPARSPGFVFKSGKGVSVLKTAINVLCSLGNYCQSLKVLEKLISDTRPDLIINFLEPLTGIYKLTHRRSVPVLAVGHQFMMGHPNCFTFRRMRFQQFLMYQYVRLAGARSTRMALAYAKEEDVAENNLFVCPPLLRRQLFDLKADPNGKFLLVYLVNHGYAQDIIEWHQANPQIPLHCFYDKPGAPPEFRHDDTLTFHALDGDKFLSLMAGARAVACTAGFESVCESAYLGKPLLLIPLANHVEQNMNAREAEHLGLGLGDTGFNLSRIADFCASSAPKEAFVSWVNGAEAVFLSILRRMEKQTLQ